MISRVHRAIGNPMNDNRLGEPVGYLLLRSEQALDMPAEYPPLAVLRPSCVSQRVVRSYELNRVRDILRWRLRRLRDACLTCRENSLYPDWARDVGTLEKWVSMVDEAILDNARPVSRWFGRIAQAFGRMPVTIAYAHRCG